MSVARKKRVTRRPPSERRSELRAALIDAAERAISRKGLGGLKARDLAEEAGCALGAIYTVFPDLDALIFEVNSRTLKLFAEFVAARPIEKARPVERLVRVAEAYLDFAVKHQPRWRALFAHRMAVPDRDIPEAYRDEQRQLFRLVEEPLRNLAPRLPDDELMLFARTLFTAVHGVVIVGLDAKLMASPVAVLRDQVEKLVRLVGAGLAGPDAREVVLSRPQRKRGRASSTTLMTRSRWSD